jgi:hypothetical protein
MTGGEPASAPAQVVPGVLQVTRHPGQLEPSALAEVNLLLATGDSPERVIREFCQMTAAPVPQINPVELEAGEVLAWRPRTHNATPFLLRIKPRAR